MSPFSSGGRENWGMKDEKMNDMRGLPRSQSILMPEKEMEIISVTPPMDS